MNYKTLLALVLITSVLLLGCTRSGPTGYATYGQNPNQQPYVGGGCGVAPQIGHAESSVEEVVAADDSVL